MNPLNQNPSHSPLLPQGSIPPKNTSRPKQVLYIAATVVSLHVLGFGLVLMQGCQKDAKTAGSTTGETNTAGLSLPAIGDTNTAMFSTNTTTPTPTAVYTPPASTPSVVTAAPITPAPSTPLTPSSGLAEPPTSAAAIGGDALPLTDYRVVSGDSLAKIAKKHNITLAALSKANPNLDPRKLAVGKTIKIPAVPLPVAPAAVGSSPTAAPAAATASTGAPAPAPTAIAVGGAYVVRSGDTLTRIAKSNGITVGQLRAANNMKTTRVLVGQKLKIPARSQNTAAAPATTTQH